MEKYDDEISRIVWHMKCFAILSVICAHCRLENSNAIVNYLAHILANLGSIGVGVFMFCSGLYFFKKSDFRVYGYLKKTWTKMIIPWFIAATATYFYITLRKGGISIWSYLEFIIGYKTIFYFMTDLLLIQLFFILASSIGINKIYTAVLSIILNFIFIFLESVEISLFPTPYLNFLCWFGDIIQQI